MIGLLLQLLYLPVRLVLLPFRLAQSASTFVTCTVPLLVLLGIAAVVVWFMFMS